MSIDYIAVLTDLKERRAKLTAAIQAIEEIVSTNRAPAGDFVRPAPRIEAMAPRTNRPGTVANLAYDVIRNHGGAMKVGEVTRMLQDMGKFKVGGRGNYGTVYGTLKSDDRFVKVGEGEFEIRERSRVHGQPERETRVTMGGDPLTLSPQS